jgi:tetratricopeptide (TPR) repeat protein
MFREKKNLGGHFRRAYAIRWVFAFVCAAISVAAIIWAGFTLRDRMGSTRKQLLALWEKGAYAEAFEVSKQELAGKPLDYLALTINGFSAYQLGIAQINSSDTLRFIDQCVWSLRKALLATRSLSNLGELYYVLGKAYYYKGPVFADLAVDFLERAQALSFRAWDINEFLGLSYANIRDYRSSVAAFALALDPEAGGGHSDLLLVSIARSYMALGETQPEASAMAKPYLLRCIETSRDSHIVTTGRLLYAEILRNEGNAEEAELQYQRILEENGENAEAHYQLGELYAARGNTTRAWIEWVRAVRLDPAHTKARQRFIKGAP